VARFKFNGFTYDLVDASDLTGQELVDMEAATGADILNGKVSMWGMIWISVRRVYPTTTWDDVAREKLLAIEWLPDPEEERLPPTSNGAADTSEADAQNELPAPIGSGNPG
jgi:hypothetical protein